MRLIDADALMKALGITDMSCWACDWGCRGWCTRSRDFSEACAAIEDAPIIDAVPVVRCKECKHKEKEQPGMVYCPMMVGSWVADDHFCAWGERRTDETD